MVILLVLCVGGDSGDRALPLGTRRGLGWPVAAGRRRAGDGGEGVTAAARGGSGRRREVGALGGGDVDGGGARLARWGEQDGRR